MDGWLRAFCQALIRPTEETFKALSKRAKDTTSASLAWLAASTTYTCVLFFVRFGTDALSLGGAILSIVAVPVAFLIYSYFINLAYRHIFQRRHYVHEQVLYATTVVYVPMQFILMPLSILPNIGPYLGWAGSAYLLFLMIVSIRSVLHVKFYQSVVLVVLGVILILTSTFCAAYFISSMVMIVPETIQ
jgi:uncharacterized membrane protein YkvA (DUF1232 family)